MALTPRCHSCGEPLEGATATVTFDGFTTLALNGVTFRLHARCLSLVVPERGITLPPRISDPVAEPPVVEVRFDDDGDWHAFCRECGITVALKDDEDDAHLAAARHLARVHSGLVAA